MLHGDEGFEIKLIISIQGYKFLFVLVHRIDKYHLRYEDMYIINHYK